MPIDYLNQRKTQNQELQDLLAQRQSGIESDISQQRSSIMGNRAPVLDNLSRVAGQIDPSYGGAIREGVANQSRGLNRKVESSLDSFRMNQERSRQDLLFSRLSDMAQQSGMDVQSANNYARQYLSNQMANQFSASEAEKERAGQTKIMDLNQKYADLGIQQSLNMPQQDYGSALTRVLLGTGTAIGTGYALNKAYAPTQPKTSSVLPGTYASQIQSRYAQQDAAPYASGYKTAGYNPFPNPY